MKIRRANPAKERIIRALADEYSRHKPAYEQLTIELSALLQKIMDREGIKGAIESRTKDIESFSDKVRRKDYQDPLIQMTDFSGVRLIVNSLEDQTRAALVIQREFEVDQERSINKRADLSLDQFGYLSRHFIVRPSRARRNLVEWRKINELWAEIQLRTVLQHAWATIEHGLNYKSKASITSDMKRDLFRLSALFELADKELNSIVATANQIRRWGGVIELDDDALLDQCALAEYTDVAAQVKSLDLRLEANGWEISDSSPDGLLRCLESAHRVGVFHLGELEWVLTQLDTQAFDILNSVCDKEGGAIERIDIVRSLIIAFQPDLFPEEEMLLEIVGGR